MNGADAAAVSTPPRREARQIKIALTNRGKILFAFIVLGYGADEVHEFEAVDGAPVAFGFGFPIDFFESLG